MAKYIGIIVTSFTLLIFIIGCEPSEKPQPAEAPKITLPEAEPAKTEPPKVEAVEVEPPKAEPPKIEPPKVEPPVIKPAEIEPPKVEPPKAELPKIESHPMIESPKVGPPKAEPVKTKPPKIEQPKVEPAKTEPPKVEPPKIEPPPAASFTDKCADILKEFVNDKGMVDYNRLKRKRQELKALLNELKGLDPNEYNSWSREDKIAFWINAYNMQMLKIIVDNYPIQSDRIHRVFWPPDSIQHIKGIWDTYKLVVMEEEFTLAEIDRRLFRSQFSEPRVFLAISRASLSGPPLRNEPYYGGKLYEQLDDQVKRFLSGPLAFKIDRAEKIVYLSPILEPDMYGKEFINTYGTDKKFKDQEPAIRAVLNFLTNYLSREDIYFLEVENYSVKYISYDWRLDEQH